MARQWQQTLELLERMRHTQVPMTRSTRNAALRAFDTAELLPKALHALQLLRQGVNAAQTKEWRRQAVPSHLELTHQGLDHAAAQLEERLSGADSTLEPRGWDMQRRSELKPIPQELLLDLLGGPDLAAVPVEDVRAQVQHLASLALLSSPVAAHLVGSRLYGAALPDADIDLVLEMPGVSEQPLESSRRDSSNALLQMRRHLESDIDWTVEEMALDARRPTLRLRKAGLNVAVEVTFDQSLATLRKSELLLRATSRSPSQQLVLLLLRTWAQRRHVCGQRQGYPSGYAFGLMAAYHWQQLGLHGPLHPSSRQSLSAFCREADHPVPVAIDMDQVNLDQVSELFVDFFRAGLVNYKLDLWWIFCVLWLWLRVAQGDGFGDWKKSPRIHSTPMGLRSLGTWRRPRGALPHPLAQCSLVG
ncbi:unnamed protein product [Durusdinium trenchii]|uniref:Poly(A) RNA polymerase mitochondrial-like central palm domain-containing protein n=1 Tax=Durusdinium trenchii TaxID=1381693 RepID=A0ABP0JJB5_9DINO